MKVFSMTPKQDIYTRGESIDLTCSASAASPSAATPKSSTIFQDAPGNEAARGLADVPRRPTFSALQPTSSHPADHSPTSPEDPQDTMKSRGSQSPPSQTPFRELKPHSAKPHGIPTTGLSSSQSTLPGSTSTSTNSQNGKEPDPLLLPLAVGCGGGGALVLLAALVCLYKRKQKASSRISSRTYWNSFKSQRSTKKRRCQDPIGIAINMLFCGQLYRKEMSHQSPWAKTGASFLNPKSGHRKLGVHRRRRRGKKMLIPEPCLNSRKWTQITHFLASPVPRSTGMKMRAPQWRLTSASRTFDTPDHFKS
ncbi:uncharacterized protein LOC128331484 isoform X1 [Hemicordylus capensis]|uniref:uncharacterized protein LOC128331484 isoform X1 n=1 Tax=Hemicordylus capensis TaxID=884348 RepID=UPI0023023FAE|nr:uncharacterized protein LOC128331484 isoform X1 [Hemicordylus capensis]